MTGKMIEKGANPMMEFCQLFWWEENSVVWEVPRETNVHLDEKEVRIALLGMPGNTKWRDLRFSLSLVIRIMVRAAGEKAFGNGSAKNINIILIFENGTNTCTSPDIDYRISDHPSIATSASSTERMYMVNIELVMNQTLDDEPRFVVWNDWTGAMEGFYIK